MRKFSFAELVYDTLMQNNDFEQIEITKVENDEIDLAKETLHFDYWHVPEQRMYHIDIKVSAKRL